MEKKIFVLGESDTVLGFSLVGVDGLATDDPQAASARLQELRRDPDMGLILITAGLASRIRPELEKLTAGGALPVVYEVPDRLTRPQEAPLRDLVRRALGVSV